MDNKKKAALTFNPKVARAMRTEQKFPWLSPVYIVESWGVDDPDDSLPQWIEGGVLMQVRLPRGKNVTLVIHKNSNRENESALGATLDCLIREEEGEFED